MGRKKSVCFIEWTTAYHNFLKVKCYDYKLEIIIHVT